MGSKSLATALIACVPESANLVTGRRQSLGVSAFEASRACERLAQLSRNKPDTPRYAILASGLWNGPASLPRPFGSRCASGVLPRSVSPTFSVASTSRSGRTLAYTFRVNCGVECRASVCAVLMSAPASTISVMYVTRSAWKSMIQPGPFQGTPAAVRSFWSSRAVVGHVEKRLARQLVPALQFRART